MSLLLVLGVGRFAAADDSLVGKKLGDFSLNDFHGRAQKLSQFADKQAVVIAFLGTECPLAKLYGPRLGELAREYADRGVAFVAIDANVNDSPTELAIYAQTSKIDFPLLVDLGNVVADQIGATRTPEVFLLDRDREIRYHGRVDDQFGVGIHREKPTKRELTAALDELLAGKPVAQTSTPLAGCLISRVRKVEPKGDLTYAGHVAAIVNNHCVECHRPGELAPFALTNYDEVSSWSAMIREVVEANRMPPWFADPRFGKFTNDCSLSAPEREVLLAWIDNGCPAGNLAEVPPPPKFVEGWRIGTPDLVYEMSEPFTVPADGTVEYQNILIDPKLTEDIWVSAAEARPSNAAVVHHIVLYAVPGGAAAGRNAMQAQGLGQMISVYAPGMNPWKYPDGAAVKVPAGTQFMLQMHYTPNGLAQSDKSRVGLKLVDKANVSKQVRASLAVNANFNIPPHAADHVLTAQSILLRDTLILNLFPHMHYRGKSFTFEAQYPDGSKEVLLDVPRYDFSWQTRYDLAEPKLMPKGTRLICTGHFDNSDANPYNPDPSKSVRFGLQSWEEMMVGYYTTLAADEDLTAANAGGKPAE